MALLLLRSVGVEKIMVDKARMKGKGEGRTHIRMNSFVFDVMVQLGYMSVQERYQVQYRNDKSDNEWIRRPQGVYHEFDLYGEQIIAEQNPYIMRTYVEIDGEAHDNKIQKNKDKTAEQMLKEYFKSKPQMGRYRLIRIPKTMVMDAMKTGKTGYLKQKLALVVPTI